MLVAPATTAPSTVTLPSIFCVTAPVFTTKLDVSTVPPPPPTVPLLPPLPPQSEEPILLSLVIV